MDRTKKTLNSMGQPPYTNNQNNNRESSKDIDQYLEEFNLLKNKESIRVFDDFKVSDSLKTSESFDKTTKR